MLKSKAFVKKTRRGNIVRVVKEHYLRDDIWCSAIGCTTCQHSDPILSDSPQLCKSVINDRGIYIIPDTNVLYHQIDLISHPAFKDIIILQTALEELRARSIPIYNKLKTLLSDKSRRFYLFSNEHHKDTFIDKQKPSDSTNSTETINDRNDRAIRTATKWYQQHLKPLNNRTVVLVTQDADCRRKAIQEDNLLAVSVAKLVEGMTEYPELLDMVSRGENDHSHNDNNTNGKVIYDEYLTMPQLTNGVKTGTYYQGSLNVSLHNYLEATIFANVDGQDQSIIISGRKYLNRAVQGDIVVVALLPKDEWKVLGESKIIEVDDDEGDVEEDEDEKSDKKESTESTKPTIPTGKVIGIIKRNWRPYCGSIDPKTVTQTSSTTSTTQQSVMFISLDKRIPKIRIRTRQARELLNKRIIVAIDGWNKDSLYPHGHFVRTLGEIGDKSTETEVLLLEHEVPFESFSQRILADLPPEGDSWVVREEHFRNRIDLREENICSIDPPGCTDIDDALHAKNLPNGNIQIGVHIADVTHFVKPNTPMDIEAAKRGTTVYLVDKRIDMLPSLLGTNLCSLRQHVERLAFSVIWEMTPDGEILSTTFTKSVIKSKWSFTYEEAQTRIDDSTKQDTLTNSIRLLNRIAKLLRSKRFEAGALTLASPEVRFTLENDSQDPVDVELKALKETNALVEEFMLLANVSVAKKIFERFPESAMLRRHPTPPASSFQTLVQAASEVGLTINHTTSKTLGESLDSASQLPITKTDAYFPTLLRIMTTRCMMQAVYFSSGTVPEKDFWHYGLAMGIYTHFTSPIRRYCDVIVHRQLSACLVDSWDANITTTESLITGIDYGQELVNKSSMEELCKNLNFRNRMAQMAGRSSVELFTNLFFKDRVCLEDGYVTRVLKNGFVVLVPKYGIETVIITPVEIFEFDDKANIIKLRNSDANSSQVIKLFLKVLVKISIEETGAGGLRSKLCMELVTPFFEGFSVKEEDVRGLVDSTPVKRKEIAESEDGGVVKKRK